MPKPIAGLVFFLAACATAPTLAWDARNRLVHIDHVDLQQTQVFEDARHRWLKNLEAAGGHLPDGRPLLLSGDAVYYTMYPFETWSDLDSRSKVIQATNDKVGPAALKDSDSGDVALVPPHHFEIWRRLPSLDYLAASGAVSDEKSETLTVEYRRSPSGAEDARGDAAWAQAMAALKKARFASSSRVYWNLYGTGELVLVWSNLGAGADWVDTVRAQPDGAAIVEEIDRLIPLRLRVKLKRRPDLSNPVHAEGLEASSIH